MKDSGYDTSRDRVLVGLLVLGCVITATLAVYDPYANLEEFCSDPYPWRFFVYIGFRYASLACLGVSGILGAIRLSILFRTVGLKKTLSIKKLYLWICLLALLYVVIEVLSGLFGTSILQPPLDKPHSWFKGFSL